MSTENIYEYLQGESQSITRWEQESAGGSGLVFIRDQNGVKMLCANIELWDASTGGTQLTLDTDYTLEYFDANISGAEGVECYAGYAVINPVYQGIALYVTGDAYGGYTSRPYRPTYAEVSSDVTVATSSMDDSIIADASSGAISVTLPNGHTKNQRFSIICTGGDTVEIIGAGITDAEFTDIGITYVWDGSAWIQLGGAGGAGGSMTNITIPQPKTFVEKWNDGGAGIIASKVNEWSDGLYKLKITASTSYTEIEEQTVWITVVEADGKLQGAAYVGGPIQEAWVICDDADSTFKFNGTGVTGMYLLSIEKWEDDPDNLPIQTIPADPSLIKDWVSKYSDDGTLGATSVSNVWGIGKYIVTVNDAGVLGGITAVFDLESLDEEYVLRNNSGATDNITVRYSPSLNAFNVTESGSVWTGPYIAEIYRWEDVAGADAQMSVPVDGWETVFDDDTNTGDVANIWGAGTYELLCQSSALSENMTCRLYLSDLTTDVLNNMIANQGTAGYYINGRYDQSANAFNTQQNFTGTSSVIKIRKFNSLVNVLHSYHPDPRQVAQKDWVEVYNSPINSASNTTFKVTDGKYIVSSGPANDTITYETSISIDNTKTLCRCVHDASFNLEYTPSTGVWNTNISNVGIHFISKWQDSQASDSPRTVLDDGFETVYEDEGNATAPLVESVDSGTYEVRVRDNSGNRWTAIVAIDNSQTTCRAPWDNSYNVTYTVSSGSWALGLAGRYITRLRKFTGKTVIDAQYVSNIVEGDGITFASINTDAGDVDVSSYFTDTSLGRTVKLRNTGTNGNKLTGCPDSISIGDGKTFEAWYASGWNYQDVIVEDYTELDSTGINQHVKKWAGGAMTIIRAKEENPGSAKDIVFVCPFTDDAWESQTGLYYTATYNQAAIHYSVRTAIGCRLVATSGTNYWANCRFEGRWKS